MTRVCRPLCRQISVDHCHGDHCRGDHHRGDPDPNYARFPSGVLWRSTTGDTDSNNAPFPHSEPGAAPRPHGCVRHSSGSLGPVSLPPFRPHVGTSLYRHQRAPAVLLRKTKALPPLSLPLLSFQIVDSRFSPFVSLAAKQLTPRDLIEALSLNYAVPGVSAQNLADFISAYVRFSIQCIQ
jgi:hypothetical protein